jgi:hypothetical protein
VARSGALVAPQEAAMNRSLVALVLAACIGLAACSDSSDPAPPAPAPAEATRKFAMGFSWLPPRPDPALAKQVAELTLAHSDAALILVSPPWQALLDGVPADTAVRETVLPLAEYYRSKGLPIVVSIDPTNGFDRSRDADELARNGRSLAEPPVQQLYRGYVRAVDALLRPEILCIASETNLVRAKAAALYAGLVQAARDVAAELRAVGSGHNLVITVQVEEAWGAGRVAYQGIAQDRIDFAFANAIGLSSYPYLGGFTEPETVPID